MTLQEKVNLLLGLPIVEVFDTDIPLRNISKSSSSFSCEFDAGDTTYTFTAVKKSRELPTNPGKYTDVWVVEFMLHYNGGKVTSMMSKISGTAVKTSPVLVMAGVVKAFTEFVKSVGPDVITFNAKQSDAGRVRLYDRFYARIPGAVGYVQVHRGEDAKTIQYILTRPSQKKWWSFW